MPEQARKLTKGQRTASRLMDAAEELFARQGYEGTSLRQIAAAATIREPGIYNHFSGKQGLYEAVLHRALAPMASAMTERLDQAEGLRDYTDLPSVMTDLLLAHPQMAALFHQALQSDSDSVGNRLVLRWLDELFRQGMLSMEDLRADGDRETLALNVIAMFNIVTGYVLSQQAFASMTGGDIRHPATLDKQKRLLRRVIRAMLIS
ncbi:TetR/AcrR family transcriptional regulator [Seongchinamella unica]|uniref:TetR/AcrR family transcriptional regulator n=1 Tax=Seongchinamella unica TaxID=2547392 RepID=A0A4R5LTH8_9GAMM|nr:TetR/AcrR family transcriptional regulator [Seongchinamella unica]TDG14186.1 TetR/AcrR family transcriptional regulator [Seongchinamella unica]